MRRTGLNNRNNKKPIIITIVAVSLLAILILITSGSRTVSWLESTVGVIFSPMQEFASTASNSIINFFQEWFNTTDADKENAQLKAQIETLKVDVSDLEELRLENERLKDLLDYAKNNPEASYVGARVIANSGTAWFDMFTLNAGRNDGVEVGDPVVNADGLVGIITDVGATWCKSRALIDGQSSIGVLVERTRDNGFARGILKAGSKTDLIELYFLSVGSDLTPGDKIVTNGLGSDKIPKGLLIGTVSEVMRISGSGTNEANAKVTSAVDFKHIEDVMIIVGGGNGQ